MVRTGKGHFEGSTDTCGDCSDVKSKDTSSQ